MRHLHTPGPWQAKAFSSPVGTFFISDSMGQLLFGAGKPLTDANAHLIAAAPEMLEACKCAEANLAPRYPDDHLVMRNLRAAIAKAEGAL